MSGVKVQADLSAEESLYASVQKLLEEVRAKSGLCSLEVKVGQSALQSAGLFDEVDQNLRNQVLDLATDAIAEGHVEIDRAIGCLMGMAVADGLGHNFEFLPVQDTPSPDGPRLEFPSPNHTEGADRGQLHCVLNRNGLRPGQWTDDTSMGLCLADSILVHGAYDGVGARIWFWNWWNNGLNNGFRFDEERMSGRNGNSLSVGLGGNISKSLNDVGARAGRGEPITPRYESESEDAGNGSLMRLAAVPVRYHLDADRARAMARESSLATHPGQLAADACDFAAYVIVRAMHRGAGEPAGARAWLDAVRGEYLERMDRGEVTARAELRRLLRAEEPEGSTERCWNWRSTGLDFERTLAARGASYNGYPLAAGYFGSFSLDGLAMALHAFYTTDSANAAVVKVVNMAGDADTTGAICGQMAGAFYGAAAINPAWVEDVHRWDRDIELRAVALYAEAVRDARAAAAAAAPAGAPPSRPA